MRLHYLHSTLAGLKETAGKALENPNELKREDLSKPHQRYKGDWWVPPSPICLVKVPLYHIYPIKMYNCFTILYTLNSLSLIWFQLLVSQCNLLYTAYNCNLNQCRRNVKCEWCILCIHVLEEYSTFLYLFIFCFSFKFIHSVYLHEDIKSFYSLVFQLGNWKGNKCGNVLFFYQDVSKQKVK